MKAVDRSVSRMPSSRGDDERASDARFARIEDAGETRTEAARDIGLVTVLRVRRPASARVTLRLARAPRASPKPRRTESRARTLIQMISARLFARSGERRATDPRSIESQSERKNDETTVSDGV